jgi:hypothetical protein
MQHKVFDEILSSVNSGGQKSYLLTPSTIYDFFTTNNVFLKIPDYQRPYSWTHNNVKALLNDVQKIAGKNNNSWFLGPLFTVKKTPKDMLSELLDGQQRITTIQIILREASLIKHYEDGIDLTAFSKLNVDIETAITACNNCLLRLNGMSYVPIFETEETIKVLFSDYISSIKEISSFDLLKIKREEYFLKLEKAKIDGSKTADTIQQVISIITDYFNKTFFDKKNSTEIGFQKFYDFVNALLHKCWLIEIPLQSHEDSIQIFESLNNRGKQLSLVDKLRYKSIITVDNTIVSDLRIAWKKVYAGLNFMEEEKYIKTEDDFFKVFFNSINGHDYTKEDQFLNLFEDYYLSQGNDKIKSFLAESLKIIDFFKIISTSLDSNNEFINQKNFNTQIEYKKVKALFQVLRRALELSENTRFLIFKLISKYSDFDTNKYIIVQGIWKIIRMVFFEEIVTNTKSNALRIKFMEFIRDDKSFVDSSVIEDFNLNSSYINLIHNNSNDDSKFTLYFNAYLSDYESLISHSPSQYKCSHLEHMLPKAWKSGWAGQKYVKTDVETYLDEIPNIMDCSNFNFNLLKAEINSNEKIELEDYSKKPSSQENTLVEFIGNKWMLHAASNIKASNDSFITKKDIYRDTKFVKIPDNQNAMIGFELYVNNFGFKEILLRSVKIANNIAQNFYNTWDNI